MNVQFDAGRVLLAMDILLIALAQKVAWPRLYIIKLPIDSLFTFNILGQLIEFVLDVVRVG